MGKGDHPHVHGEYQLKIVRGGAGLGSPPRTWGIPKALANACQTAGITPTYMGNTEAVGVRLSFVGDHPHVHGEYY